MPDLVALPGGRWWDSAWAMMEKDWEEEDWGILALVGVEEADSA